MTKYNKADIINKIEELGTLQSWNHNIELPYGVNTIAKEQVSHGKNLVKWSRIKEYVEMIGVEGMRVLDVGCNEGFFSLKLAEMGAKEVIAVDADELRIEKARAVCDILEVSNIKYEVTDIFDTNMKKFGHFDLVLCLGFLHRIPYPYHAIRQLTEMGDMFLFEWKSLREGSFDLPVMKFCGGLSKDSNIYSGLYWLPSVQCVVDMLTSLGFTYNLVADNSAWRRTIVLSSRFESPVFKNRSIFDVNKFTLLRRFTRSYLGSILRTLKNKEIRWQ
jgi:SAM-dependent methyltransferase